MKALLVFAIFLSLSVNAADWDTGTISEIELSDMDEHKNMDEELYDTDKSSSNYSLKQSAVWDDEYGSSFNDKKVLEGAAEEY